jgi:hypothetical protein
MSSSARRRARSLREGMSGGPNPGVARAGDTSGLAGRSSEVRGRGRRRRRPRRVRTMIAVALAPLLPRRLMRSDSPRPAPRCMQERQSPLARRGCRGKVAADRVDDDACFSALSEREPTAPRDFRCSSAAVVHSSPHDALAPRAKAAALRCLLRGTRSAQSHGYEHAARRDPGLVQAGGRSSAAE